MERSIRAKALLDHVERLLADDPEVLVPVRKLWVRLQREYPWRPLPTFSEFLTLLREDERFEYWPLGENPEAEPEVALPRERWSVREAAACERGPRVKLRRIPVTETLLLRILRHQIQGLLELLR